MLVSRNSLHGLAIFISLLSVFGSCFGQPALAGRRLALVIGINRYDNLPLSANLKTAAGDAKSMSAALTKLGYEVETGIDVDRREFNRLWSAFVGKLSPDDSAVFHFSGHGVELSGVNYLIVRDAPEVTATGETLLRDESIPLNRLLDDLRRKGPRVSWLILDACRNNPFDDGRGRGVGGAHGLAAVEAPKGTFIMYSAGIGQTALDRLGDGDLNPSSVYTRSLMPLIATPGLSLSDIAKKVRGRVRALALTAGNDQTPAYYDEVIGDFYPAGEAKGGRPELYDKVADAKEIWLALKDSTNTRQLAKFAEDYSDTPFAQYAVLRQADLKKHADDAAAECDRLAASAYDDAGKNGGVKIENIDIERAIPACREAVAANADNLRLMFELGRALFRKDADEAAKWIETAAAKGYAPAMSNLGAYYYYGRGIPQDYVKARFWIERGAEAGDLRALNGLGMIYFDGFAVERDYVKAREWLEKAAAKDDPAAMITLGVIYADGDGVPRNFRIARRWFERAAAKGEPKAMMNLAGMYEKGEGMRRDHDMAEYWKQKAISFGYVAEKKIDAELTKR